MIPHLRRTAGRQHESGCIEGGELPKGRVAILRTTPRTLLADYHWLMNLAATASEGRPG